jgi:hypothetical protein
MKVFEHFNSDTTCPLCKETTDKPCVLIPIRGTKKGMNYEAIQVHEDCLIDRAIYDREYNVIYAVI